MTLIEMMVVLVIMSLVAAMVGSAVFSRLAEAKLKTAQLNLKTISNSLEMYRAENNAYPDRLEQLVPRYASDLGKDPWDVDWQYERSERGFRLLSFGPDGKAGGGDDLVLGTRPLEAAR